MQIFLLILHTIGFLFALKAVSVLIRGDSTGTQKIMLPLMLAIIVQNGGYMLELVSTNLNESLAATKIEYIGGCFVAFFYMIYIRQ